MTDSMGETGPIDAVRREILTLFGIGVYGFTPGGAIAFIDEAAFQLMGLDQQYSSPFDIIGKPVALLPGAVARAHLCQQLATTGIVRGMEWFFELPNGKKRWIFEDARLIPGKSLDGAAAVPDIVQSAIRDISMRKYKEAMVGEDPAKYQHILENMREGYYEVDREGRLLFLNRQLANLMGEAEENLLGEPLITPDTEEMETEDTPAYMRRMLMRGEPAEAIRDWCFTCKDGRTLDLEISITVRFDETHRPIGLYGLCRDVTAHKHAETAARIAEARYNQILEEANDIIYTHDLKGNFTSLNQAGKRISGYTREEMLRRNIFDLIAPEHRQYVADMLHRKTAYQDMTQYELEIVTKDGRRVPIEVNTRILFEEGSPIGVLGIGRDITERRQAEEQHQKLEQRILHAQKLEGLGVLAGGIAHDFNNLLVGVLGNAGLALRRLEKESPLFVYLKRIEYAAQRASELTNQMLTYAGHSSFLVRPIHISRLVMEMTDLIQASLPKTLELRLALDMNIPAIMGDASQLQQVVMNLLTNASEAIGEKPGRITIGARVCEITQEYLQQVYFHEASEPGNYVCLEFSDTGCGMTTEQMAKIFDPFYTTKFTGRGLGLAAILGIIRGHKGAIHVYSECDTGTTFKLYFPVTEVSADTYQEKAMNIPEESRQEIQDSSTRRGLVLVADDEETVRAVTHEILIRSGYETLLAVDGQEAWEMFLLHEDDITGALIDLTMPHMNGQELMEQLRKRAPKLPIIISSGYTEEDILERFHRERPSAFIQKPYRARDLMALIQGVFTSVPASPGTAPPP